MPLNAAGVNALLDIGKAAVVYAGVGSGVLAANQTSAARIQLTLGTPVNGVFTVTNVPMNFTGAAAAGATNLLLFSAAAAGTFYGNEPLTGDQAFNSAGEYQVTAVTITGTGI